MGELDGEEISLGKSLIQAINLCVVISSLFPPHRMVEYSLDLQNINLSAIRTVRVLRPLKAINRVPSKRRRRFDVPH